MQEIDDLKWAPLVQVRYSSRAKRLNMHITHQRGLEVVVPKNFDLKQVLNFVAENRNWIEYTYRRLQIQSAHQTDIKLSFTKLELTALNQTWQLSYAQHETEYVELRRSAERELRIIGPLNHVIEIKKLLRKWLKQQAEIYLIPKLAELSQLHQLPYSNAKIRHSQTRWGSCSPEKTITLSTQLLFLPPNLVQHVMLHELCHLEHLNHSRKFWQLLMKLDPSAHESNYQLKQAQHYVPKWLWDVSN